MAIALSREQYDIAQSLLQPLEQFWESRGLISESRAWNDRCLAAVKKADGSVPDLTTNAGRLWLYSTGSQVSFALRRGDLDAAYGMANTQCRHLEESTGPSREHSLGIAYHQLGFVEQSRGNFEEAERWYLKALDNLKEGDETLDLSAVYHQLGITASRRKDLDAAERWFLQGLEIKQTEGDQRGMAKSYHHLAIVAELRGDIDSAESWYRKSLAIELALDNRPGIAVSYQQLGNIARRRDDLDAAEQWYLKALEIKEMIGDPKSTAYTYRYLAQLSYERHDVELALDWLVRSVALFSEYPHPAMEVAPDIIATFTAFLGIEALERSWERCTGDTLPEYVRKAVLAAVEKLPEDERGGPAE
jgi:tetratricopeptide (TPR) repeat protein